jgi:hypothetical protein
MRAGLVLKAITVFAFLCVSLTTLISAQRAQRPFAGTWKMDVTRSKWGPGKGIKELTLTFEAVGDKWKQVGTGTYSDGSPLIHNYVMAWDGKDHPINGKPPGWTLAVLQVDDYTQNVTVKQDGKVVDSGRVLISKDGKTMTTTHQDPDTVEVFEKQ